MSGSMGWRKETNAQSSSTAIPRKFRSIRPATRNGRREERETRWNREIGTAGQPRKNGPMRRCPRDLDPRNAGETHMGDYVSR